MLGCLNGLIVGLVLHDCTCNGSSVYIHVVLFL